MPCHIFTGTGLVPATSAPRLRSFSPHLHRDWDHPCHICTGTGTTPATSAPGLDRSLLSQAPSGISLQWTSLQGNAAYLDWVAENVSA